MKVSVFCAAGLVLASAPAAADSLADNGSFEAPDVLAQDSGLVLFTAGSPAITGWTVIGPTAGDTVQLVPDTYRGLPGSDGRQWVDLTGNTGYDKGLRSDTIATIPGATYHVSFDVGNFASYGIATLGVQIGGDTERLFTNTSLVFTPSMPMNWASFGFDWVASGPSTQLTFLGRANGTLSNASVIGLDNVAVVLSSVPEPMPAQLLAVGLVVLALARWRPLRRGRARV